MVSSPIAKVDLNTGTRLTLSEREAEYTIHYREIRDKYVVLQFLFKHLIFRVNLHVLSN